MKQHLGKNGIESNLNDSDNKFINVESLKEKQERGDKLTVNDNYLCQNIEIFLKPVFFKKYAHVSFSKEFPNEAFEEYFQRYDREFDTANQKQIIDEVCTEIVKKYPKFILFIIEMLTIINTNVDIDHIFVKSKIQLTNKSLLTALYSVFVPQDLSKAECAIEIFANSKAVIKNCHFYDAQRVAVIVRNYSSIIFENCTFDNNKISCFIMDDSYAKFVDCKFKNDKNISIFVTKESRCELYNCLFKKIDGKAIYVKDSSRVYMTKTRFIDCKKGAVTIAESSILHMDVQILIQSPQNTAIRALNFSHIKAIDVVILDASGNAINIENSNGYFVNCTIVRTIQPTIAVIGDKSNPIFHNCNLIDNGSTFCVICKNFSRPLFDKCKFSKCSTNCFSVSDFSRPHIQNCIFDEIDKFYINAFSCSRVTYDNLQSIQSINFLEKIHESISANCINESINEAEDQDDLLNNFYYNFNHILIKSWRSPKYTLPPEIQEMQDPDIIVNELTPLKIINLSKSIKRINAQKVIFKCSECSKELNENDDHVSIYFINPCGHILCSDCITIIECPICNCLIKEIKKIYIEDECSICLDRSPNMLSLPCGHFCICYKCAVNSSEIMNYNCPLCNELLNSYKYVCHDI